MSVVGLLFDSWRVTGIEFFGINIGVDLTCTFIDKFLVLSLQPVQNIAMPYCQHAMGLSRLYMVVQA